MITCDVDILDAEMALFALQVCQCLLSKRSSILLRTCNWQQPSEYLQWI